MSVPNGFGGFFEGEKGGGGGGGGGGGDGNDASSPSSGDHALQTLRHSRHRDRDSPNSTGDSCSSFSSVTSNHQENVHHHRSGSSTPNRPNKSGSDSTSSSGYGSESPPDVRINGLLPGLEPIVEDETEEVFTDDQDENDIVAEEAKEIEEGADLSSTVVHGDVVYDVPSPRRNKTGVHLGELKLLIQRLRGEQIMFDCMFSLECRFFFYVTLLPFAQQS